MTVTWTEVLATIATLVFVYVGIQLVRTLSRIGDSAAEIERVVKHVEPRLDRLLETTTEFLKESRTVVKSIEGVASDASSISDEATRVIVPMIRDLNGLRDTTRRLAAIPVGMRVGLAALSRSRRSK